MWVENNILGILASSGIKNFKDVPVWLYKIENIIVNEKRYVKLFLFDRTFSGEQIKSVKFDINGEEYSSDKFERVSEFNLSSVVGVFFEIPMSFENVEVFIKNVLLGDKVYECEGEYTQYTIEEYNAFIEQQKVDELAKKKKSRRIALIVLICIVVIVAGYLIIDYATNGKEYTAAKKAFATGNYIEAAEIYKSLSGYKDADELYNESLYVYAQGLIDALEYEKAYDSLLQVSEDYQDTVTLKKQCYYELGKAAAANGDYAKAIEYYHYAWDYEDCMDYIYAAKYGYVVNNLTVDDSNTLKYIDELKEANYKDINAVYNRLYAWKVSITAVNDDGDDESSDYQFLDRTDRWYFHYKVSGGPSGGSTKLKYNICYPNGEYAGLSTMNGTFKSGSTGWVCAYYSYNAIDGTTGPCTVYIYDSNNNLLTSRTVDIL